ncbi:MAG: cation:dicarboxylase symporter family transporter, partial [Candidatus Thermoplasmatota archaeon]|nr:cation:dicarboxylase symporter family transporter [Candidatus Thermoplasmatota archaeon]
LLITEVAAISVVLFVMYSILLKSYGISPLKFFKGAKEAMLTAFITRSSSGTLPVTMMCADKNFGISRDLYSFTLPLGATINMNGTVIGHMAISIFAANIVGVELSIAQMIILIIAATMAAVGTAGVPMGGLITLTISLGSVGLPFETIGLVMGIYVIIDMFHTVANVTGDIVCTNIISKQEKMTDWEKGVWKEEKTSAPPLPANQDHTQASGEGQ